MKQADPDRPVMLNLGQGVAYDNYIGRGVRRNHPDYLYVTHTMDVLGQLEFGLAPGWAQRTVDELIRLHLYRRLASERDAIVLGRVAGHL